MGEVNQPKEKEMNVITLYGHLGKDREIKQFKDKKILELSLATNLKEKGEDVTVWWRIVFWEDRFRNIEKYLTKGSALIITGELKTPKIYKTINGEAKVSLEVAGKDIRFNPFNKGSSDSKTKEAQDKIVDIKDIMTKEKSAW